ncbi:MAG: hypothetical protein QHH14_14760 [Clostridiales bacterium]|jgi:hypothetical protein|nr:hypothetical protein [Clostridiales bacterium]
MKTLNECVNDTIEDALHFGFLFWNALYGLFVMIKDDDELSQRYDSVAAAIAENQGHLLTS